MKSQGPLQEERRKFRVQKNNMTTKIIQRRVCDDKQERWRGERYRYTMLLALKMAEGAISQGMSVASNR